MPYVMLYYLANTSFLQSVGLLLIERSGNGGSRGGGVGGFLFDDLLERFRRVGVRRYYLFTDTGCNVGFYTCRGLTHRREEKVEWDDGGSTVFYLEEGTV